MLVSEKQMKEGEGLFIHPVVSGLGYQTAGAFQRLGRRMEAFVESKDHKKKIDKLPLKLHTSVEAAHSQAGVFSPHPALSYNVAPPSHFFDECIEMILKLRRNEKDFHDIWVLPINTLTEELERIRKFSPRATLLLSPAAYGFRDEGLFDETLQTYLEKPGLLDRVPKSNIWKRPFAAVSFAELAGHLITLPLNEKFFGKNIILESSSFTPVEWLETFRKTFAVETSFMERLTSKMSFKDPLSSDLLEKLVAPSENLFSASEWTPSAEVFPAPPVSLERALSQLSQAQKRHPELELVFTPSRAPG